jgi:hypothetical protein
MWHNRKSFWAITVSLWLLFFSAYVPSYILAEADFIFLGSHWENRFLENSLAKLEDKWEMLKWNDHIFSFFGENGLLTDRMSLLSVNFASVEIPTSLRC